MNDVITGLIGTTGIVSLLFMITYITFGRPWQGFFGRGLMGLECGIFAVMLYAFERRLVGGSVVIPHNQLIPAALAYGIVVLMEGFVFFGLWQLLVTRRGGMRSALRIRRARREALASSEPIRTILAALDLLDDDEFDLVLASSRPR
jgi:hypothetical protein